MKSKNPYEYLKTDYLEDGEPEPIANPQANTITDSREEVVTIYTSKLSDGRWVYGYAVYWANKRLSCKSPTAENGIFKSEREASLHAVGFMLLYADYFTEATKDALQRAEQSLTQASLF